MKRKRLIIIAPNDRYNYGDLLFSHIIKFSLKKFYDEVINVSTINNDLSHVGGDKVKDISFINSLSDDFDNDVIIGGGEAFCSKWRICLSYLSPNFRLFIRFFRKIIVGVFRMPNVYNSMLDSIARIVIKGRTHFPYTIGKNEVLNVRFLFYNSLGGSFIKESSINDKVQNILKSVDYLSLRDRTSFDLLKKEGVNSYLYPDSAVLMSDVFTREFLITKISTVNKDFVIERRKKFIVFQINKKLGLDNYNEILDLISGLYKTHNMRVYLCPVGFALGHEDNVIAEKLYKDLGNKVFYQANNTIWDIMYIISESSLYIGTSLHGAITAMSFNVPYLGVLVNKTIQYIREWGIDELLSTSTNLNVYDNVKNLLNNEQLHMLLVSNSDEQKQLVQESFNRMALIISSKNDN